MFFSFFEFFLLCLVIYLIVVVDFIINFLYLFFLVVLSVLIYVFVKLINSFNVNNGLCFNKNCIVFNIVNYKISNFNKLKYFLVFWFICELGIFNLC